MKKVLISCGPIPGKLDSVKYITNRFKGGLALKTAKMLSEYFDVTVVAWEGTDTSSWEGRVTKVKDVFDYFGHIEKVTSKKMYDAYIKKGVRT